MATPALLYPVPGPLRALDCCHECFQRPSDLAHTRDPRTGDINYLCRACSQALNRGETPVMPTGDLLTETWERLVRDHNNQLAGERTHVTSQVITHAMTRLAPHLDPHTHGWPAVTQLREAYLRLAYLDSDRFDPADGDREYLELLALADVKNALSKLTGGAHGRV